MQRSGTGVGEPAASDIALAANAVRALAMDAVETAKSGHPGMPMGMADVAAVLFAEALSFDAAAPDWPDRDRFVLSAGHGSMLLYAIAHLVETPGMPIEELRNFRQLGSRTAGHPEYRHAPLVETTTGPLGQGLANAVGMAMTEAHLSARFGSDLVDHRTWVIAGDGCLMEGISQEALALAGHLRLRKLIVLWDDNRITIDGSVSLADSTEQLERFEASGWRTMRIDGHDFSAIARALAAARESDRPTLIACRTVIGRGAPTKQGTAATHGAPLGPDEVARARKALDWPYPAFEIPEAVRDFWRRAGQRGAPARRAWALRLAQSPQREAFQAALKGEWREAIDPALDAHCRALVDAPQAVATRKASELALEVINAVCPQTIGGSADLTGSNNTKTKGLSTLCADDYAGRYVYYGIREHAMAAAMNGMALHGGVIPYGGTFLVFADYCRPAIRLSALMGIRVIYVMTHDSIGLGEDGPTHQPVEHLASLRAIPNLAVYRPADAVETAECWALALSDADRPSVIALSRQNLPQVRLTPSEGNRCALGAYVVAAAKHPDVVIIATGSEVSLALDARDRLAQRGVAVRVVSAPCFERFSAQDESYRRDVLGKAPRIGVEAAIRQGWDVFLRRKDAFVGMTGFGASAPAPDLYQYFGLTVDAIAAAALDLIDAKSFGKETQE